MKKIIICLLFVLACTGCDNTEKYQESIKEYALKYYDEYMIKSSSIQSFEITIEMMKNVGYDLKELEKCKDSSSITLTLKENTTEIDSYQYNLNCK